MGGNMNKIIMAVLCIISFLLLGCAQTSVGDIVVENPKMIIECESFKDMNVTSQSLVWSAFPLCAMVESNPSSFGESFEEYRICFVFDDFKVGGC